MEIKFKLKKFIEMGEGWVGNTGSLLKLVELFLLPLDS